MGLDPRIGSSFLRAGVGYGGSCFPKDVDAFVHLADQMGYDFRLLREVQRINQSQREHLLRRIRHELWIIQDKIIAVYGLAFKPGTDDIRQAPSLYFVSELLKEKARLRLWDPVAVDRFREGYPDLDYFKDPLECATDAELLLILTDWPQIRELDLSRLKEVMKCPVIVDGRNMFDPETMRRMGFEYSCVGRP
ncbi:MAG TPA: UDP-glucose/GDP-mannose dehydrogenase family protein, partial [Kiritimatiellae bacterium]|nr:UDP-glucose/GDP-mannose dehydrogenase family protein [Kiritimatiellia bacterium]